MMVVSRGRLLSKGGFLLIVGTLAGDRADAGGAELSEGLGELVAQPLVVLGQFPVAGGGGLQPGPCQLSRPSPGRLSSSQGVS